MRQRTSSLFATQWLEPYDHDIKKAIEGLAIIDIGTMKQMNSNGTCDVLSYRVNAGRRIEYKNIEVLFPAGMGLLTPGEPCLIFRPVISMSSIKNNIINAGAAAYDSTGAKCIPVLPIQNNVKAGIDMNGNFTVTGNGVAFTIAKDQIKIKYGSNEDTWSNDGTTSSTSSGGTIDTSGGEGELVYNIYKDAEQEGGEMPLVFSFLLNLLGGIYITATEESERKVEINIGNNQIQVHDNDDDGKNILLKDANENTISLNEEGTTITCTNGNVITLDEHGVDITDVNGHKLTLSDASDGIAAVVADSSTISIKNSANSLGALLQELGQYLISAGTVGSPGAHTMNPATQSNFQSWIADVQKVFS